MNEIATKSGLDKFLRHFDQVDFSFDSKESLAVREMAKNQLAGMDFPATKTEYWKYTRVAPVVKHNYTIEAPRHLVNPDDLRFSAMTELVFVNGFLDPERSQRIANDKMIVCSLSEAKRKYPALIADHFGKHTAEMEEVFAALNTAYHNDGAFIWIGKDQRLEQPVHLIHLLEGNDRLSQPRNLIVAEQGSEACIVETFDGSGQKQAFINSLTEISLDRNARLEFIKTQDLGGENNQVSTEQVVQKGDSFFNITSYTMSGKLVRNNLNIALEEPNSECFLNGLYLAKGTQHVDNHTIVDHKAPHCESNELYKGILNERSTGVFNGRVLVRQAAQKTNAFQSNANILLTDDATSNSKPELEIYADDVKCSHGSTTGQLDDEALFYLQARGINKERARNLLLHAFAGEVIERSTVEQVKERIGNYIARRYDNNF